MLGTRRGGRLTLALACAALAAGCEDGRGRGAPTDVNDPMTIGSADAPVTVVELSDFGCPYCARFARNTLPVLRQEYVATGKVRWRYRPISMGFPGGGPMAAAAICAAELHGADAFWTAHDLFYERQSAMRGPEHIPAMLDWLAEAGMDRGAMQACIESPETLLRLQANNQLATDWLAQGTPTFIVNGVPMSGAYPTEFFRRILDTVLDPSGL